MKDLLTTLGVSVVLTGLTFNTFANGGSHNAANILNPNVTGVLLTNTINLTNIIANPVQTNSTGCNTNFNAGGITYTNYTSIGGSSGLGVLYQTVASAGICSTTAYINGTNTSSGLYYTNDPTVFLFDVPIVSDGLGNVLTNYSLAIDYQPSFAQGQTNNIIVSLTPILWGDLNKSTTRVDTTNTFTVNFSGNGTASRVTTSLPLAAFLPSTKWAGIKGFRCNSVSVTNLGGFYTTLYDLRLIGWSPWP
jgi:hypothetical protein